MSEKVKAAFVKLINDNPGISGHALTEFLTELGFHRHEVSVAYIELIDNGIIVVDEQRRFWPA